MSTSSIPPIGPNHGIGRINPNTKRQQKRREFSRDFEEEAAEQDSHAPEQETRILQPEPRIIRRESEDGGHHIDVIA